MSRIKVLIVDDHPMFLEGLYTVLSLKDPEIEVVGTAENGEEALAKDRELEPDVVLLDIKMPGLSGIEVARRLKSRRDDVKIIVLTTFDDRSLIADALKAGAKGYLLKDVHASEIIEAIKHVNAENVLMSGDLAVKLSRASGGAQDETGSADATVLLAQLSAREVEILRLVAQGERNAEIGAALFLTEKTVRNYISHIYEVLGAHTRTQAALWAVENLR